MPATRLHCIILFFSRESSFRTNEVPSVRVAAYDDQVRHIWGRDALSLMSSHFFYLETGLDRVGPRLGEGVEQVGFGGIRHVAQAVQFVHRVLVRRYERHGFIQDEQDSIAACQNFNMELFQHSGRRAEINRQYDSGHTPSL